MLEKGQEVFIQNQDPAYNGKGAHVIRDDGNWVYLITLDGLRAELPREQVRLDG